jgi:DNA-binding response OmpR family regulator
MGGTTVLVVDDDSALRLLCRVNLELEGHRVLEAATIAEARRLLAEGGIDVLLLDVHVGSDDGRLFLRTLRAGGDQTPVALFTGSATLGGEDRALADGVLPKPFQLDDLVDTVRALAAGRHGSVTVPPR